MALALEIYGGPPKNIETVRLLDGERVLAVRRMDLFRPSDYEDWCQAAAFMTAHDRWAAHDATLPVVSDPEVRRKAEEAFGRAVDVLFPSYVPEPTAAKAYPRG